VIGRFLYTLFPALAGREGIEKAQNTGWRRERGFTHKRTRLRGGAYNVTVQREVVGSWVVEEIFLSSGN
jgi:hypothetical protein